MKTELSDKFAEWMDSYQPDVITQRVLQSLVVKYQRGSSQLFDKFIQLERDQHFELCLHFKSMIDFLGLSDEFMLYKYTSN